MSSGSNGSNGSDDDKSIGDCTMYETTAELIITNYRKDELPNIFTTILENGSGYDFTNDVEDYRSEYNAKNIPSFKIKHTNHIEDGTEFENVSGKFQLLYLIINTYNSLDAREDDETIDIDGIIDKLQLKRIPSSQNVEKFFKCNKIGEHTGEEIDASTQCPVSPITPAKTEEPQHMKFDGPPMLQEALEKAQKTCNSRKRSRSPPPPPKGGKRKTRKVLKRIPKVLKWRDLDPPKKTLKSFKKKHGNKCFLRPKELKYPICDKYKGKVNCKGLLAAHNRAMLSVRRGLKPKKYSYKKLAKTARKVAKKHKCNWVLKKSKKSKK